MAAHGAIAVSIASRREMAYRIVKRLVSNNRVTPPNCSEDGFDSSRVVAVHVIICSVGPGTVVPRFHLKR